MNLDVDNILKTILESNSINVLLVLALLFLVGSFFFFATNVGIVFKGTHETSNPDRKKANVMGALFLAISSVFIIAFFVAHAVTSPQSSDATSRYTNCKLRDELRVSIDRLKNFQLEAHLSNSEQSIVKTFIDQFYLYIDNARICSDSSLISTANEEIEYITNFISKRQ